LPVQRPGEFVVTFPCAYHGGFNTGLNCAEAVNFASPDWLRFGSQSVQRFQSFRKQPVLSHSWLLLKVCPSVVVCQHRGVCGQPVFFLS